MSHDVCLGKDGSRVGVVWVNDWNFS